MRGLIKPNQSLEITRAESQIPKDRIPVRDGFENMQPALQQVPAIETPATRELHNWEVAFRKAEGEVNQNRVLNPQGRWKKLSEATEKALAYSENHQDLRQHGLEALVQENYYIARSESNILNPSWLSRQLFNITGQGLRTDEELERPAHIAVLRESIEGAIHELRSIPPSKRLDGLIANYESLLHGLPAPNLPKDPETGVYKNMGKFRERYWKSLTARHPNKASENWFSDETASSLRTLAGLAMLSPVPQNAREQPGIAAKVNAEIHRRRMATERGLPSAPVDEVLSDLKTALNLAGPAEVCFDLEDLAKNVAKQMDVARPALEEYQAVSGEDLADFGNKHANLVRQARLIDALESGGAQLGVHVPMPEGVRTQQVHALLRSKVPEIYGKWSELGEAYKAYIGSAPFLQTEQAQRLLSEIDHAIAQAFDGNTFEDLGATPRMRAWLKGIRGQNGYLMVRSTGAEDSKESANAGGNLSEAYVAPDEVSVSRALGNVVRSYFGSGSLQNRINAGRNPFSEELKLAVTMQELIGEEVDGTQDASRIPRSLVLFTNEPIWVGGEKFRVMRLSATYGHGEGVVGNQGIAGDTILVLNSLTNPGELYIIYENQDKPSRLAPVRNDNGRVTLQQIPNPPELRRARVFNEQEIARLFQWGIIGESYFGGPTDMEIVVLGDMIYPVQARPVNRLALLPSYIDLSKAGAGIEAMRANAFVPGKGSVVEITHPDQVLIADTLEAAEKVFIKGQHRVVIVSQKEPANSHPVVNFSSMGMTCLAVPADRQEQLHSWLDQLGDKSIAVCPQSGALYLIDKDVTQKLTSNGFVAHPAQTTRSFELPESLTVSLTRMREVPKELEDLLMSVNTAPTSEEALKHLQELRTSTWNQQFRQRRAELEKRVLAMRVKPKEVLKILDVAGQLGAEVDRTFNEAELALKSGLGRLRALFQTKSLGSLLFERQSEALNQFSVATINAALDAAGEIASYQAALSQEAQFSDILLEGQRTPDSSVYPLWKEFLTKLEVLPPTQTALFKEMITELKSSGEMAMWMTLEFRKGYADKDISEALAEFKTHFPEGDQVPARKMIEQLEQIRQLRRQLADFQEPEKFEAVFQRLTSVAFEMTAEHLKNPASTSFEQLVLFFQRLASMETEHTTGVVLNSIRFRLMADFVELYDSAIKSMKTSQAYSAQEKVLKFKEMLIPYMSLMKDWLSNLGGLQFDTKQEYIRIVENSFNEVPSTAEVQLFPSKDFNVAAAKISSGALVGFVDHKRHRPQTLEDFFTLAHQNFLSVIGSMASVGDLIEGTAENELGLLKQAAKEIESGPWKFPPLCIGTRIEEDSVSIQYLIPLREHGFSLGIRHTRGTDKIELKGLFSGQEEGERWGKIAFLVDILEDFRSIKLLEPVKAGPSGVEFSLEVSPESMVKVLNEIRSYVKLTFDHKFDFSNINLEEAFRIVRKISRGRLALGQKLALKILLDNFENLRRNQQLEVEKVLFEVILSGISNRWERSEWLGFLLNLRYQRSDYSDFSEMLKLVGAVFTQSNYWLSSEGPHEALIPWLAKAPEISPETIEFIFPYSKKVIFGFNEGYQELFLNWSKRSPEIWETVKRCIEREMIQQPKQLHEYYQRTIDYIKEHIST